MVVAMGSTRGYWSLHRFQPLERMAPETAGPSETAEKLKESAAAFINTFHLVLLLIGSTFSPFL